MWFVFGFFLISDLVSIWICCCSSCRLCGLGEGYENKTGHGWHARAKCSSTWLYLSSICCCWRLAAVGEEEEEAAAAAAAVAVATDPEPDPALPTWLPSCERANLRLRALAADPWPPLPPPPVNGSGMALQRYSEMEGRAAPVGGVAAAAAAASCRTGNQSWRCRRTRRPIGAPAAACSRPVFLWDCGGTWTRRWRWVRWIVCVCVYMCVWCGVVLCLCGCNNRKVVKVSKHISDSTACSVP